MADSIRIVFGIANNDGIHGYSCSVYFVPSEEYFESISISDDNLKIKK